MEERVVGSTRTLPLANFLVAVSGFAVGLVLAAVVVAARRTSSCPHSVTAIAVVVVWMMAKYTSCPPKSAGLSFCVGYAIHVRKISRGRRLRGLQTKDQ